MRGKSDRGMSWQLCIQFTYVNTLTKKCSFAFLLNIQMSSAETGRLQGSV